MGISIYFWIGFHVFIFLMLALDLGVFHKRTHIDTGKRSYYLERCLDFFSISYSMCLFIFEFGKTRALEFLTGYVIEYSLSVDNIFIFILIFTYFAVPARYQHKILFWGILGALIMRGIFIFTGVALINKFHWIVVVFGGFLLFTGMRMLFQKEGRGSS